MPKALQLVYIPYKLEMTGAAELKPLRVAFIGAGTANFGSSDGFVSGESLGAWNHAARLEQLPGIEVTAIVDPHTKLAAYRLKKHQHGKHASKWTDSAIFSSYKAMLESEARPEAAIVGAPSDVRGGCDDPSCTMELDLAQAGIHMLVEKPISIKGIREVQALSQQLQQLQEAKRLVISVGYQMRYLPAVEAILQLLAEHGKPIAAVLGRFYGVYNCNRRAYLWDEQVSGGIIVQQATHFVDLMRYIGGDIDPASVVAAAVGPGYPLSETELLAPEGEAPVPFDRRSNRVTTAAWHFQGGAVGMLVHSKVLHERSYFTELEVLADGLHIILEDAYNSPKAQKAAGYQFYVPPF
ncbi:hypothetical protein WJX73_009624 [Symbiochloris irregularis]|uniref:Oxidoreductase n=1 Tax=Symbiochloris irregularis TaxID=706552 RepID=A0AAW1P6Z2_9CHLO